MRSGKPRVSVLFCNSLIRMHLPQTHGFSTKGDVPLPPPPLYLSFLTNPLRLKLVTNKLVFQENSEKPLSEKFNLLLFTSS